MQRNHIGTGQELFQVCIPAVFRFQILISMSSVSKNLHSECLCQSGDFLPDSSKSDDSHGFPAKLHQRIIPETEILRLLPSSLMDRSVVVSHLIADFQQKRHGILCHRCRSVGGNVGNRNAFLSGGLHIHHIVACSQHSNIGKRRGFCYDTCGKRRFIGIHNLCVSDTP